MPAWNGMPYRGLLLDLRNHVRDSAHILRARNGERLNQRVVHWVVQDRIKRLLALPLEGFAVRW